MTGEAEWSGGAAVCGAICSVQSRSGLYVGWSATGSALLAGEPRKARLGVGLYTGG